MKTTLKILLLPLLAWSLSGCTTDEAACSKAENVNDPECQKQISDVDDRPLTLAVEFKNSNYYDQNSSSWVDLNKDNLEGGIMGSTISIYSDFLNVSSKTAMSSILLSMDQAANPSKYLVSDYNRIPYLEVALEDGVDYIFSYTKTNPENVVVYQKQGKMVVQDGRAILPLINETFDGQFFNNVSGSGLDFDHTITIAAQSQDKVGTRSTKILFNATLQIPNTDFTVSYSQAAIGFNLQNRWSNYYNGTSSAANSSFPFITLKENKVVSEQVPLELRITFQTPPEVLLIQNVFFEMPFDVNEIKSTTKVNPQRGYNFYVRKQELKGTVAGADFKMKIRINGADIPFVTNGSANQAIVNLGAGVPWNMEVYYDFTPAYSGILSPLRPVCNQNKNEAYDPITIPNTQKTVSNSGGYMAICHPTENRQVIIPSTQMNPPPYVLADTWFGHFSYVPYDIFKREVGHFYGIRDVTLQMKGCVKVEVKVGDTYQVKTKSHSTCDQAGMGSNQGWVSFFGERKKTIFENMNDYESITGLKGLMQSFGSRSIISNSTNFFFNGQDLNPTKKIY